LAVSSPVPDLIACDGEPIHIPGSIQPHGLLLVADATGRIVQVAGDVEGLLGTSQRGTLSDLIGAGLAARAGAGPTFLGKLTAASGERLDVTAHRTGEHILVELEPAAIEPLPAAVILADLDAAAATFLRTDSLQTLCDAAAVEFRKLTGFDRVMIYRFLEDESGRVLAEDRRTNLNSFLNHHFPASDIPRQARALYVRNHVRVIPDVAYLPAPLRPQVPELVSLDLSDSALRSVSPIHIQYLQNMGVAASASVSIVTDGVLWGLVACHHETPRHLSYDIRAACRALAGGLARQIKAKEEAEGYRERIRLRSFEDDIVQLLSREGSLDDSLSNHLDEVGRMLRSDGVAVLRGQELVRGGATPDEGAIRALAALVLRRPADSTFHTDRLSEIHPEAEPYQATASGLLSIVLSAEEPWVLLWFRAEQIEVVEWAGNPHKQAAGPKGVLTPRASFAAWRETVRGRSRRWTLPEIEAAGRLRSAVREVQQTRRVRELNRRLSDTLRDKDQLIEQKQFLIGEVNHRVQNSLQLVSSFLILQGRASGNPEVMRAVEEASRRLSAVGLVHRRLYRGDQFETIDGGRYVEELCADTLASMGEEWAAHIALDLAPVMLPTDRAISMGLVLTELIINANKYAYGGAAGPLAIRLAEERASFQLTVADKGVGRTSTRKGFGSRMIDALVKQLGGTLSYEDDAPGLRAVLTAPVAERS
jgi:light-regulated signal transduction histidine kinase (bacteriophytochrome)